MSAVTEESAEFCILPIQVPAASSYPHTAVHEIRLRRNAPKIPTADDHRSLFLKNVPVDSTESHFRAIFKSLVGAGRFDSIIFADDGPGAFSVDPALATKTKEFAKKRKRSDLEAEEQEREEKASKLSEIWKRGLHDSSGTAIVLLADEKSVQQVLKALAKLQKSKRYPVWGDGILEQTESLGSEWISSHLQLSHPDKQEMQRAVHAFFNVFNRKEKEAADLARRLRNEPDEDGFVTVTRGGRAAPANRSEAEEARQKMIDKQSKKKSEMKDFYRFQLRERRKAEQDNLLRRFQDDRNKVKAMRESRARFKPET